jgi:2-oxoglutarate ferredoxin oxidoreductase subunit delta
VHHDLDMSPPLFTGKAHHSEFVILNAHACEACWCCVEACPSKVIGKVNLPWHKHAVFRTDIRCTGCFKCIKACKRSALSKGGP